MKKKFFICLILCTILCGLFTIGGMAENVASGTCGENVTWVLDDTGKMTIAGTGPMSNCVNLWEAPWADYRDEILTVEIMDGVTTIGKSAFYYCDKITSVTIPTSVTRIEDAAFHICDALTSIKIPNSVTYIGKSAFYSCDKLQSITIPASVVHVGDNAFTGCSGMTTAVIAIGVQSMGSMAFSSCNRLTSISIPYTMTSIGDRAFAYSYNITNIYVTANNPVYSAWNGVLYNKDRTELICCPNGKRGALTMPDTVKRIGDYAFYACQYLTSVTMASSVTSIGKDAFYSCGGLGNVTIPMGVTHIEPYAFRSCGSLTGVTIQDGVTSIGERAFSGCYGLKNIVMGKNVANIGVCAFGECQRLESITVSEENPFLCSVDGVLYTKDKTEIIKCPAKKTGVFAIPDGITTVGAYAFEGCENFTQIEIPSTVTHIATRAFFECEKIENICIPDSVVWIGDDAIELCSAIKSVQIGTGVTHIGRNNFSACGAIESFTVAEENKAYSSEDGVLYDKEKTKLIRCPAMKEGAFYVPDSVLTIGRYAFYHCRLLTEVTFGRSLQCIEEYAFFDTAGFETLLIPYHVTTIEEGVFECCMDLQSVVIGSPFASTDTKFASIGSGAFGCCESLTTVVIGNTVGNIGDYAFTSCWQLTNLTIGSGVKNIGYRAFYGCPNEIFTQLEEMENRKKNIQVTETAKEEERKMQVTVELDEPTANTAIMVMTYDKEGRFVGITTKETTEKSNTTIIEVEAENASQMKTLLWQEKTSMVPLSVPDAKTIE